MATLQLALLAREIRLADDGEVESIIGITDGMSSMSIGGKLSLTMIFWCVGSVDEVLTFRVAVLSPNSADRGVEQGLVIKSDRAERPTVTQVPVELAIDGPGRYGIALWFEKKAVWSRAFTVGLKGATSLTLQ